MPFDFSAYLLDELDTDYPTKHDALVNALQDAFNNAIPTANVISDIDWTATDYHVKAMSSNTEYTFSNVPASGSAAIVFLELAVSSGAVPTWPAAVAWEEEVTPVFTSGKTHLIAFITRDGGTTVRGIARLNFAS